MHYLSNRLKLAQDIYYYYILRLNSYSTSLQTLVNADLMIIPTSFTSSHAKGERKRGYMAFLAMSNHTHILAQEFLPALFRSFLGNRIHTLSFSLRLRLQRLGGVNSSITIKLLILRFIFGLSYQFLNNKALQPP